MHDDDHWMSRALDLAERGRGYVEPNPLVGAVLVKDGRIVGEGWHERFGGAHAEVNALAQAENSARGATCHVTLEPCCHHGKTPPCTDALIKAGVARVCYALADPFLQVAGRGAAALQAAGITVNKGVGADLARRQNAPYLKLLATGRPYVHAKWAMTLDGKIATRTGDSKWITGDLARRQVHALRGRMDVILVGVGTALADDPLLTARPPGPRVPLRIVLDSQARLPPTSQLVATAPTTPTMVVATEGSEAAGRLAALEQAGCQTLVLAKSDQGRVPIGQLLDHLGKLRHTNLLVEGGSEVLGSFLDAGAIDEVHVFIAAMLVGGRDAKT